MGQAYSGVQGNVVSGTLDMDVQGWTLDYEMGTFDSTTTADLGWAYESNAVAKISGSFDIFYNASKKPTGAAANLTPGNNATLIFYVNKTQGDNFTGLAKIQKLSLKSKVPEGSMVTVSFTSLGPWTVPS